MESRTKRQRARRELVPLCLLVSPEQRVSLDEQASRNDRSRSAEVRQAIEHYLADARSEVAAA